MSNISNNISINFQHKPKALFTAYYPLALTVFGTLFNSLTFIILCQSTFKNTNVTPTIHYLRTIAIFDIIMLYGWNLDHYLSEIHGFTLQLYSIPFCKIFSFLNYFAAQVSAWLRVFICLDRYLSLTFVDRTWFNQSQNVLIIILCNIIFFTIINLHFFLFTCFYNTDGSVNPNARFYIIYPLWDYVNLGIYNCIPFILMVIFNSGVIYHLIRLRQITTLQNPRIQHRSITITLVITTFLFLIMTTPGTICYAFFSTTASYVILHLFDSILYTYHILSFPLYLITYGRFRRVAFRFLVPQRQHRIRAKS